VTEQQKKSGLVRQILEVFYAPQKAFREIAENPRYLGPLLIMIIFSAMFSLVYHASLSRAYVEQTIPVSTNGDQWTENGTLWASNANITESDDHINGVFYGNKSIDFSTANSTRIWMRLDNIGPVNCSGSEGYKNVSMSVKPICPNDTEVANVSLYLQSSPTDYFYYDLTPHLLSANDKWNNFTIPLRSEDGWSKNGTNADWSDISIVKLEFVWAENASFTVRIDGLFFRGSFKSALETISLSFWEYFVQYLLQFFSQYLFQFGFRWIAISTFVYLLIRWFGGTVAWKYSLILTGFALLPMIVQAAVDLVAFSALPLVLTFEPIANQFMISDWLPSLVYSIACYVAYVWIVALLSIMIHGSMKLGWFKSLTVGALAFVVGIVIEVFIFPPL
jgi:hypothetical protein